MDTSAKSVHPAAERAGQRIGHEPDRGRGKARAKMGKNGSITCPLSPHPLQRKPEGLALSPEAPGKECSQLPSANSKAGWLAGSADLLENSYPLPEANNGSFIQLTVLPTDSAHPQAVLPEMTWQRRRGSLPNTMAPQ